MMISPSFDELRRVIKQYAQSISDDIGRGAARDFEHYRSLLGEIRGLLSVEDLMREIEEDNNDPP